MNTLMNTLIKKFTILVTISLSVLLTISCADTSMEKNTVALADIQPLKIAYLNNPKTNTYTSGQPTKEQIANLGKAGIQHIIDLRPLGENTWDEAPVAQAANIQYHRLPIAGIPDLNAKNAMKLSQLLTELQGQSVLLHCASGNRVGALTTLSESLKGSSIDEAITEGKRWGLTRLEPVIRDVLSK